MKQIDLIDNNNKDNKRDIDIEVKEKKTFNSKNKVKKLIFYIKAKKRRIIEIYLDKEIINTKVKEKEREVNKIAKLLITNYYTLYNSSINNYK